MLNRSICARSSPIRVASGSLATQTALVPGSHLTRPCQPPGDLAGASSPDKNAPAAEKPAAGAPQGESPGQQKPTASPSPGAPTPLGVEQLINKAVQEFDEYQRLTSQGKLGEAGQKLEQHKRTLEELKRAGAKKP